MVGCRDRAHGHAQPEWGDFGAVQEIGAKETDGDEHVVQINKAACGDLRGSVGRGERCCNRECYHAARHFNNNKSAIASLTEKFGGRDMS